MKKILFGITSLTLGGAERVLVDLANKLCEKYDITIFTIYANGELEKELNSKVKLKSLYNVSYKELSNIKKHFTMPLKVLLGKRKIYKNFTDKPTPTAQANGSSHGSCIRQCPCTVTIGKVIKEYFWK